MTDTEIEIQIALGTLPYKEYMKLQGIIFKNDWWYFPIPKASPRRLYHKHKTTIIDDAKHYPVADEYIEDLYYSMAWRNWTEEEFAREIIAQCYSCMENIDQ